MKIPNLKRNVFDLSHEKKLTCDMGKLIPIMCEEVLPGDYFKCNSSMIVRLSPLVAPMMHRVDVYTHFFFVPNRLLWANWEKFITGGVDGADATVHPYINFDETNAIQGSLADYFGVPPMTGGDLHVSALPFRGYVKIFNEWYRNQNTRQTEIVMSDGDGADVTTVLDIQYRSWEKDYFTSCLPWAQRNANPVTLPLGDTAPVVSNNLEPLFSQGTDSLKLYQENGVSNVKWHQNPTQNGAVFFDTETGLEVDLANATAVSINDVRSAFQVQKWMERMARGGARYIETILSMFGVRGDDLRLQRPLFLGGGKSPIIVSETLQTSETTVDSPQGNMAGHGFSAQANHSFRQGFTEHGLIIGILSILPKTCYGEGLSRTLSRTTKYDYFWPLFQNLGEQAVLNKELYVANDGNDDNVFGYQGRYDEYRHRLSSYHGMFRNELDHWHMARIFGARPSLNATFTEADDVTKRVHAVTDEDTCYVQIVHNLKAVRPICLTSEPGLIDH